MRWRGAFPGVPIGLLAVALAGCGSGGETGAFVVDVRTGDTVRMGAGEPLGWSGRSLVLFDGRTVRTVGPDGRQRSAVRLPVREQEDEIDDVAGHRDRVAFVVTRTTAGGPPRNALVTQLADGTQRRVVARRAVGTPVLSDDGRRVVVSTAGSKRPLSVSVDGRSSKRLTVPMTALAAVKGGRFIGDQERDAKGRRRLILSDGRRSRTILRYWVGGTVSPSPDGRLAVVDSWPVAPLAVIDLRTAKRRPVEQPDELFPGFRFAWTSDSRRFAGGFKTTLLTWNAAGAAPEIVATFDDRVVLPGLWAPDRRRIAVTVIEEPPEGA